MTHAISGASAQPVPAAVTAPKPASSPSASSTASSVGPAVKLSLSNVSKNDAAQGDPDHDGH